MTTYRKRGGKTVRFLNVGIIWK